MFEFHLSDEFNVRSGFVCHRLFILKKKPGCGWLNDNEIKVLKRGKEWDSDKRGGGIKIE